jgi:hypothetical protein
VRDREEKLTRLVDGAMDAIVELDSGRYVTHAAAERIFAQPGERLLGVDFRRLLADSERPRLAQLVRSLDDDSNGPASSRITGVSRLGRAAGRSFRRRPRSRDTDGGASASTR